MNQMNKLETKEAVEILLSEKKKTGYKLAKAYDSYCLLPNEHDQEDWDNYSALVTALEMAVEALEKQIPKNPIVNGDRNELWVKDALICPVCNQYFGPVYDVGYCKTCGQKLIQKRIRVV